MFYVSLLQSQRPFEFWREGFESEFSFHIGIRELEHSHSNTEQCPGYYDISDIDKLGIEGKLKGCTYEETLSHSVAASHVFCGSMSKYVPA